MDFTHLDALELALSHERERLRLARHPIEIQYRSIWVRNYEREIAAEREYLGLPATDTEWPIDDLARELSL